MQVGQLQIKDQVICPLRERAWKEAGELWFPLVCIIILEQD